MNFFSHNLDKTLEVLVKNFLSKIKYGKLEVIFPSGEEKIFFGVDDQLKASIIIHNYRFLSYVLKRGSVGYAEAYMKGYYSTPNLTDLLMLSHKNEEFFLKNIHSNIFYSTLTKFKHFLKNNSKFQSKKNIKYHYDLGNKFYEKWLDQT